MILNDIFNIMHAAQLDSTPLRRNKPNLYLHCIMNCGSDTFQNAPILA